MNALFASGLVLAVAVIGGAALWQRPAVATTTTSTTLDDAAAPWPDAPEDLARALLALLDERQRSEALLGASATSVLPPTAAGEARGLLLAGCEPAVQRIAMRLLAMVAPARAFPTDLRLAWAGSLAQRGPFHLRLCSAAVALEWWRTADGTLHARHR